MTSSDLAGAIARRHERMRSTLRALSLDALVLNPGPTLAYMTGLHFHLSERPVLFLLPVNGPSVMVLPELERQKTESATFDLHVVTYPEAPDQWQAAFDAGARTAGVDGGTLGVEPRWLRYLEMGHLQTAAPAARLSRAGEEAVAELRMHKDGVEIDAMRRATAIAQDALRATLSTMRAGITERETSAELIQHMLRLGSAGELPFQPIIAFGPNSANPHAVPTDRKLQHGDLVLFDWGANWNGYFSDLTRTFTYGDMDEELLRIGRLVEDANAAGRAVAGPGQPAGAIDRATRAVIEAGGYGPRFVHRTGHGLGIEIHEEPYIRGDNQQILRPGMTFTIEPGIYLTGKGGVRIEDDMLITADGAESLSDLPRAVVPLGID